MGLRSSLSVICLTISLVGTSALADEDILGTRVKLPKGVSVCERIDHMNHWVAFEFHGNVEAINKYFDKGFCGYVTRDYHVDVVYDGSWMTDPDLVQVLYEDTTYWVRKRHIER